MFILIVLLICLSFTLPSAFQFTPTVINASTEPVYARVLSDDVCLYKSQNITDDYSNVLFILPKTYFVQLIDLSGDFYKVNYNTFTGYVKKDSVQAVVGTPVQPFLSNTSFRVYSEQSRDLRSAPTTKGENSSQVAYIPLYSRNLTYYGKIVGETLVEERTNIWYYCKYTADKDYYGYVYSDFCDFLTGLTENTEDLPYTQNPTFAEAESVASEVKINNKATKIVIAVLMIPALIFIFLIIKGSKLLKKENGKAKEVKDY